MIGDKDMTHAAHAKKQANDVVHKAAMRFCEDFIGKEISNAVNNGLFQVTITVPNEISIEASITYLKSHNYSVIRSNNELTVLWK